MTQEEEDAMLASMNRYGISSSDLDAFYAGTHWIPQETIDAIIEWENAG